MSTRCQVVVKGSFGDILFYRHSDGYPEGAMPTLQKFMGWIRRGVIRNNAEQASGWLILIGADEYGSSYDYKTQEETRKENLFEPDTENPGMGWKCGAYEPASGRHGDIEFLYILDLQVKTISCYAAGFGGKGFPDKDKDKLQFVDTAEKPWKAKKTA